MVSENGNTCEESAAKTEGCLTDLQSEILVAYRKHRSIAKAARSIGISFSAAEDRISRVKSKMGIKHTADLLDPLPELDSDRIVELNQDATEDNQSTKITVTALMSLLRKQDFKCALSGVKLTPSIMAADHIIPVSDGGEHVIGNVQLVTEQVNKAKGTMPNGVFVAMCQQVAKHNATAGTP